MDEEYLKKYIKSFFDQNYDEWEGFYEAERRDRYLPTGISNILYDYHGWDSLFNQLLHDFVQLNTDNLRASFVNYENLKRFISNYIQFFDTRLEIGNNRVNEPHLFESTFNIVNKCLAFCKEILAILDTSIELSPYSKIKTQLFEENYKEFVESLEILLTNIPYSVKNKKEGYFHSNIHIALKILGFKILSEQETATGRIDSVIEFSDRLVIVEYKINQEATIALDQILKKEYFKAYKLDNYQKFALIGISMDVDKYELTHDIQERLND